MLPTIKPFLIYTPQTLIPPSPNPSQENKPYPENPIISPTFQLSNSKKDNKPFR